MADAEGEFQAGEELDGTLEGGFQGGSAGTDDVADAQAVRSDDWCPCRTTVLNSADPKQSLVCSLVLVT